MTEVLVDYENTIAGADGSRWAARACGRLGAASNMWEGWIEFFRSSRSKTIRKTRDHSASREDLLVLGDESHVGLPRRRADPRARGAPDPTPRVADAALRRPARASSSEPTRAHGPRPLRWLRQGEDILVAQPTLSTRRTYGNRREYELMTGQATTAKRSRRQRDVTAHEQSEAGKPPALGADEPTARCRGESTRPLRLARYPRTARQRDPQRGTWPEQRRKRAPSRWNEDLEAIPTSARAASNELQPRSTTIMQCATGRQRDSPANDYDINQPGTHERSPRAENTRYYDASTPLLVRITLAQHREDRHASHRPHLDGPSRRRVEYVRK